MLIFYHNHQEIELKDIFDDIVDFLKRSNSYDDNQISYQICGWPKEIEINKITLKFLSSLTDVERCGVLLQMIFYIDMSEIDVYADLMMWLGVKFIEVDGVKNSFEDLYLFSEKIYEFGREAFESILNLNSSYVTRFMFNHIFRIDQKYNWAVIFKYDKDTHNTFPLPDYKKDFQNVKKDLKVNSKIIHDSMFKSTLLIPNIRDEDMLALRLSLGSDYHIFSWASIKKILDTLGETTRYF